MEQRQGCCNIRTEQQENLEDVNQLFSGMPPTLESIQFSSIDLGTIEKQQTIKQKFKRTPYPYLKQTSIEQHQEFCFLNQKQNSFKSSKTCFETLNKLKQQRQQLNKRKLTKMRPNHKPHTMGDLNSSLGNQRITSICKNVIAKLRRNNIYEPPLNQQNFSKFNFSVKHDGVVLQQCITNILDLYGCLITLFLLFCQTFSIVFSQFQGNQFVEVISAMGLVFYCLQIVLNFLVVKKIDGVSITKIQDITHQYLHSYFIIDISIVFIISATFLMENLVFREILLFLTVLKLPYVMDKFSKFERGILSSLYYQRYWSLFKIILFNFAFAHFIAIILNLMTTNQSYNWQVVKGISNAPFIQKYIWSYYWATTIMLTVGFGDIVPVTSEEAVWMIFVEIISCIAFSYNISCLGNLIGNIRAQKEEIQKNRSIFQNMSKYSGFSENLVEKIESYIDQSVIIRNKFNIQEEKDFIQSLPSGFKEQVMCQSNKNMLMKLSFFGSLLEKSIYKLSEKIQRQMYHPEQTLRPYNSTFKVRIIKEGKIGYICRNKPNWLPVNTISVSKMDSPFLMTIEFLTHKQPNYEIKSLDYSIVHELSEQALIQALRAIPKDFQYYSFLKDKSKHMVDEFETVPCDLCATKHTHCDCPKFHYVPLSQHIIYKYLHSLKVSKNKRNSLPERSKMCQSALKMFDKCNKNREVRNDFARPNWRCHNKTQLMFMSLLAKKPFNEENVIKQTDSIYFEDDKFLRMTNQMLKDVIRKEFQLQDFQDEVWKLKVDIAWNYDMYSPQENSINLQKIFNLEKRLAKWMKYEELQTTSEAKQ